MFHACTSMNYLHPVITQNTCLFSSSVILRQRLEARTNKSIELFPQRFRSGTGDSVFGSGLMPSGSVRLKIIGSGLGSSLISFPKINAFFGCFSNLQNLAIFESGSERSEHGSVLS